MSFTREVPKDADELKKNLDTLFASKSHVKKIEVNPTSGHLEVTLDWLAHANVPDFYLPLKRANIDDAKALVEKMLQNMNSGVAPSGSETNALYDMIDPAAQ
jgi:hypothetical protein